MAGRQGHHRLSAPRSPTQPHSSPCSLPLRSDWLLLLCGKQAWPRLSVLTSESTAVAPQFQGFFIKKKISGKGLAA